MLASRTSWAWGSCLIAALACTPPPAPPRTKPTAVVSTKPAPPPAPRELEEEAEPPAPTLRTGRISPIEHAEPLELKVRRHVLDGDEQLLEVVLPSFANEAPGDVFWLGAEARVTGSSAPFQLVSPAEHSTEIVLWLRRPKSEAGSEVMGDAYTPLASGVQPGHHFRFRAPAPSGPVSPELPQLWAAAAARYLSNLDGAFGPSAARRLRERYKLTDRTEPLWNGLEGGSALADLMDTFTGRGSLQAALATRNGLRAANGVKRTLPLSALHGPQLERHPWPELSRKLATSPPDEPLAAGVPADFYFVRSSSFGAFSQLLSLVQELGAPARDVMDGAAIESGTLPRYLSELGVETGDLSRVLGPEVIRDFAAVGSDPYLHEGSDVTLLFRLKSPLLFRAALVKALATYGASHGGISTSSVTFEGVTIDIARSPDGRVRQHHASVGEFELVSNSLAATKRVILSALAKAPRLADELDFKYMLARDASVPSDTLAFIGERFVEQVVGPAQKIAEARRQVALAELTQPPVAGLLYGWIHGRSPVDRNEVVRAGLLNAGELKHADGGRIEWSPGVAPRSSWGTPAELEPLIDLPPVKLVSPAERDAYAYFARAYQGRWSQYIDPIAVRLSAQKSGDGRDIHMEVRVLPFVPADEAASFDLGGDGRVVPLPLASGARVSVGIGADSELRRELTRDLGMFGGRGAGITLDWLGDYAMLGFADRNELAVAAQGGAHFTSEPPIERPASAQERGHEDASRKEIDFLAGLPVYAVVALRSRMAAAVALAAARQLTDVAPGAIDWAPFAAHRGIEVVRVSEHEGRGDLGIYYALVGDNLVVSMNRSVMRSLIDQVLDGKLVGPKPSAAELTRAGQVVLELSPSKKGPMRTLLTWAFAQATQETTPRAARAAEAVLRGAPEIAHQADRSAQLSMAYFGSVPLAEGSPFWLAPEGVTSSIHGSAHAPEWPALPVPGSPAEHVLGALNRVRTDLSFDDELVLPGRPTLKSLRARLDLRLR